MIEASTRRDFLRRAATASCCLAVRGMGSMEFSSRAAQRPTTPGSSGTVERVGGLDTARGAPIVLITGSVSTDANPRARAWVYLVEVLRRAGLFFDSLGAGSVRSLFQRPKSIVLLAGHLPLSSPEREALATWVRNGGALIGLGGTSGLGDVFGVQGESPLAEGWMKVTAGDHPVTAGLRSSLHVFGGFAMKRGPANTLADVHSATGVLRGSALLENRFGKGLALLLAPDLLFSIVHIQQGLRVLQDGKPTADGSAPINDGLLKAEDGLVLDWERDRVVAVPESSPLFLEPITDELREIVLRGIFHLAHQQGLPLPVLWYWPRLLKAVGHISHDTDSNEPDKATALLEVMNRCQIKSTWCVLYPGGYPREFYGRLNDRGFEIGLHYDSMTGGALTRWSRKNFLLQREWLMKEAGLRQIVTNKNHYTRWEGRLDFLRWCEEAGFGADQTRGPSKKGTIGFPLGGSQPYFPLDDEADSPRFVRVLEVNLLTQDLVVTCPPQYGKPLLESALRHHGVAHFLFHPAHILKPGVAEALAAVVDHGRSQGLEWWTSRQIWQWETTRRRVTARFDSENSFTLRAPAPLAQATLLLLRAQPAPQTIAFDGQPRTSTAFRWCGFDFDAVNADLPSKLKVRVT